MHTVPTLQVELTSAGSSGSNQSNCAGEPRRDGSETTVTKMRRQLQLIIEDGLFTRVVTSLILINAVILGLETEFSAGSMVARLLSVADFIILIAFTIEIAIRLFVYRSSFFRSGWNLFDLAIVSLSWLPAVQGLSVLRALRIMRVLRLISVVPQLRRVIGAIGHAIPGMASVIGVLGLVFYISAVLTTKLFGSHPDPQLQEWFGSIGASAYTLFQVMTLESWSMGIVRPTMEIYPWAWLFFVPFIIVTSFAILNLFIGIIVDSMQAAHAGEEGAHSTVAAEEFAARLRQELEAVHRRFDNLEASMSGHLAGKPRADGANPSQS